MPSDKKPLEIGQWYWVKEDDDDDRWFGCVIHVGSNYVEMSNIYEGTSRIHFDDFDKVCTPEANPEQVIQEHITKHQGQVNYLMGRVTEITARLGVAPSPELTSGNETQALVRVTEGQDYGTYKAALVKAKKDLLPDLFKKIEKEHEELAHWMKAMAVPWEAQVEEMKGVIGHIDDRIFNVRLYAGLTEEVEQVLDGEPAPLGEKIRVFQRLCYMDEECLAQYEVGGMEFKDIYAFDAWLARPDNLNRLLPFPRCIVSFKVRRHEKKRENFGSFINLLALIEKIKQDEYTFLYIRNGEKLYRMGCDLNFGSKLFPDMDHNELTGKLWAKVSSSGHVDGIVTDNQLTGLKEDYARKKAEHKAKADEHKKQHAAWKKAKKTAEELGQEFKEREPWFMDHFWEDDPAKKYQEFEPNNIYYDDIQGKVLSDIKHHNRIGLIIQGLLDRSPLLHPHPPWKIWTMDGFREALELVYDGSRALVGGEKPDFEAYRKKTNASLRTGSVTIGQEDLWEEAEAEKLANDPRRRQDRYNPERYRPYGNPGPGNLAKVSTYEPRAKRCTYAWHREGQSGENYGKNLRTTFTCDAEKVFNVDAYKPGDFRKFFNDPRTREEYLKWAPILLEAEEYHAGNREVLEPIPPQPRGVSSYENRRAYERQKRRKLFLGKAVILKEKIETRSGKIYPIGSLWRVIVSDNGFTIVEINKDGTRKENAGYVRCVDHHKLCIDPEIPSET
jgi:hypothetical protein